MSRDFLKGYCQLYAEIGGRDNNVPASVFVERLAERFFGKGALTRHVPSTKSMGTVTPYGEEPPDGGDETLTPLWGKIDGYLDGFEYTHDEEDSSGAVTPEMLARVYERLMGDNRDKGAYYTPHEIVDYMCCEALVAYLCDTCHLAPEKAIRGLVNVPEGCASTDWGEGRPRPVHPVCRQGCASTDWGEGRPRPVQPVCRQGCASIYWGEGRPRPVVLDGVSCFDQELRQRVVEALWRVRICDPAVGAGAFPMGWLRLLRRVYASLGVFNEPKITRHIIEHNLYGMDIDAGAVEVTKWRLILAAGMDVNVNNMWVGDTLKVAGRAGDGPPPSRSTRRADDILDGRILFDIVVGNPPYFVYQGGRGGEIEALRHDEGYRMAFGGKLNAYKLFLACALRRLCSEGGVIAYIFQNSFLCDRQAARLRHYVLKERRILSIDSFPERDSRHKRVFEDAKMSVCITLIQNSKGEESRIFPVRIWDDREMRRGMHTAFSCGEIEAIDPEGYTIPRLSREDIPRVIAMRGKAELRLKCYEGELNMTTHRRYFLQGCLTGRERSFKQSVVAPMVLKGASIQRYAITLEMSQGEVEYLDEGAYLRDCGGSEKAWHHRQERIAMQGMTGANDSRRLVMAVVPPGCYLANSCNYILPHEGISTYALLAILNSDLINWYFRCFSTNSNVNVYEVERLPIPRLSAEQDAKLAALARRRIKGDDVDELINKMVEDIYMG